MRRVGGGRTGTRTPDPLIKSSCPDFYTAYRQEQIKAVACPRNQPFRTAPVPRGSGLLIVCTFCLGEAEQGGEIADQLYLQLVVDRMESDLIDKTPENLCGLFSGPIFLKSIAEAVDL